MVRSRYLICRSLFLFIFIMTVLMVLPFHVLTAASNTEYDNSASIPTDQQNVVVHLYFADNDHLYLKAESRSFTNPKDPAQFGQAIVRALINGPQQDLLQTLPKKSTLRSFFVTKENIAYVDLGKDIKESMPGGAKSEMLAVYSIVNSLILNIPEIEKVKILIGGRESSTLDGHMDLRFPFKANMLLIR
jgi:hypothetical protein